MDIITNIDLKIIKPLKSEGVNSKLYLVEDSQMGRQFILKKIKNHLLKIQKNVSKNQKKYVKQTIQI